MRIVLVIKTSAVEVYSETKDIYTLVGVEPMSIIENENLTDYENRMIFVVKELCTEMRGNDFFKKDARNFTSIDIVLCSPWCTYEAMHIEKNFDTPTKVTLEMIDSLRVVKKTPGVEVFESVTSNVLLNGYKVSAIQDQLVESVELQYLAVYASSAFLQNMRRTVESIFHIHKVYISSIYTYVQSEVSATTLPTKNELRVILEEESIDFSYMSDGKRIVTMFVPYSYTKMQDEIQKKLVTDDKTVTEVLTSRTLTKQALDVPTAKNAKHLWPDLDSGTKEKIESILSASIENTLKQIRNCIDEVDKELLKESTSVCVYGVNKETITAYGYELAKSILEDGYVSSRIKMSTETVFVKKIF